MRILSAILRFVIAAVVLMLVGYVVPGFSRLTFGQAVVAAFVIAGASYLIGLFFGRRSSTYGRGIVGFLVSALVIYLAQIVVPGMHVTVVGALLSALVIGLADLFVPTAIR